MLPKTRLHLFMTRTLVILRLNYSAGVKINSSTGFFYCFYLCVFWSLITQQVNIGANILHIDERKRIRLCRVVGVRMKNRQMYREEREQHAWSHFLRISEEAFGTKTTHTTHDQPCFRICWIDTVYPKQSECWCWLWEQRLERRVCREVTMEGSSDTKALRERRAVKCC